MDEQVSEISRFFTRMRDVADEALRKRHPSPALRAPPSAPTVRKEAAAESTAPSADGWLSVEDAVRHLRLPSAKALYQAIRRGRVPVHHFGRCLRFLRVELDEALSRR